MGSSNMYSAALSPYSSWSQGQRNHGRSAADCTPVEQHAVVSFIQAEGVKLAEIHRMMLIRYGMENSMAREKRLYMGRQSSRGKNKCNWRSSSTMLVATHRPQSCRQNSSSGLNIFFIILTTLSPCGYHVFGRGEEDDEVKEAVQIWIHEELRNSWSDTKSA